MSNVDYQFKEPLRFMDLDIRPDTKSGLFDAQQVSNYASRKAFSVDDGCKIEGVPYDTETETITWHTPNGKQITQHYSNNVAINGLVPVRYIAGYDTNLSFGNHSASSNPLLSSAAALVLLAIFFFIVSFYSNPLYRIFVALTALVFVILGIFVYSRGKTNMSEESFDESAIRLFALGLTGHAYVIRSVDFKREERTRKVRLSEYEKERRQETYSSLLSDYVYETYYVNLYRFGWLDPNTGLKYVTDFMDSADIDTINIVDPDDKTKHVIVLAGIMDPMDYSRLYRIDKWGKSVEILDGIQMN